MTISEDWQNQCQVSRNWFTFWSVKTFFLCAAEIKSVAFFRPLDGAKFHPIHMSAQHHLHFRVGTLKIIYMYILHSGPYYNIRQIQIALYCDMALKCAFDPYDQTVSVVVMAARSG